MGCGRQVHFGGSFGRHVTVVVEIVAAAFQFRCCDPLMINISCKFFGRMKGRRGGIPSIVVLSRRIPFHLYK